MLLLDALLPRLLLVALSAAVADPPRRGAGAPVPSDPVFQALKVDGKTISGRIRQLGPGGVAALVGESGEQSIPLPDLVKLERDGDPPAYPPEGSMVLFPEGDRLRAAIGNSTEAALEVRPSALGDAPLAVPFERMLGVILNSPVNPEAAEALIQRVRNEPRKADAVWFGNGDRLTGDLLGIGPEKVTFQAEGAANPVEFDRSGILALGTNPSAVVYPPSEGDSLELTFLDGSRLGVSEVHVEQGMVVARSRIGPPIRLPLGDLSRVHVRNARIVYLSDREPVAAKYIPYIGPARPYRKDLSVDGRPLRLSGRTYDRGLGTQGRTYLIYRLDGTEKRFQALVGLDERAGTLGSVVFRVLVDNKVERFASSPKSARDVPELIDVDIAGARLLILEADFGERGDVRDFADWVEARLIR